MFISSRFDEILYETYYVKQKLFTTFYCTEHTWLPRVSLKSKREVNSNAELSLLSAIISTHRHR